MGSIPPGRVFNALLTGVGVLSIVFIVSELDFQSFKFFFPRLSLAVIDLLLVSSFICDRLLLLEFDILHFSYLVLQLHLLFLIFDFLETNFLLPFKINHLLSDPLFGFFSLLQHNFDVFFVLFKFLVENPDLAIV